MNEVEKYIQTFPLEVQEKLNELRSIIFEVVPHLTERICMRMPTFDSISTEQTLACGFNS